MHYLQRVGMEHIKNAVLEDAENRQALHARLPFALSFEEDPWRSASRRRRCARNSMPIPVTGSRRLNV